MEAIQTAAQKLVGKSVRHRAFGSGTIEELSGNVVTVNFPEGDKKFIYPDAFEQFLKLEDKESLKAFNKAMETRRRKIEEKQQEISKREEARKRIRSIKILPNSHAIFSLSPEGLKNFENKGEVFTGRYSSGFNEGCARTAGRLKPNSLCLLTCLEKGQDESERTLKALFMLKDDFYGEECRDGLIPAHEKYSLSLDKKHELKLWQYVDENERPKRFGGIGFRYISENAAKSILKAVKENAAENKKASAEEFYDYFCRVNKLSK